MKLISTAALCLIALSPAFAQVGIGTTNPNPHAVLDLKSAANNQGVILPSLTTAQRTASNFVSSLGAAESGLLVYDSDAKAFYFWNGTAWVAVDHGAGGTGTVTGVATGTGLTGGPITTTGTISLANTGVAASTYGDATHVAQIAVDAQGRITSAASTLITGVAPTGAATGDLTGNYPSPAINTGAVNSAKILDASIVAADLSNGAVTDAKIASGVTVSKLTPSGTAGQVLTTVAGTAAWANLPPSGTGTLMSKF